MSSLDQAAVAFWAMLRRFGDRRLGGAKFVVKVDIAIGLAPGAGPETIERVKEFGAEIQRAIDKAGKKAFPEGVQP